MFIAEIYSNIDVLKKSVADGKSAIASAITSQGVSTATDATFAVMAGNIKTVATNKYNTGYSAGYNANGDVKHSIILQVAAYKGDYNAYCDLRIDGNLVFQWNGNANNQNGSFTKSI